MVTKPLVFVSSTSRLSEERQELLKRLPRVYELYLFEEDRAQRASPEAHCRKMIGKSDVFVGILGLDYGSSFPAPGEKRSIVEWEFDQARAREELEILAFIRQIGTGEARDPAQQLFVDRVSRFREGHWCRQFSTASELVEGVRASLEQWLAEFWTRTQDARVAMQRQATLLLTGMAVVAIVGLILTAFVFPPARIQTHVMVAICTCAAAVVVLCGVLLLREMGGSHEWH